jgi:hypothetical protein
VKRHEPTPPCCRLWSLGWSRGNSRKKGNHAKDFCPQKDINELVNSLCNSNKSSGVLLEDKKELHFLEDPGGEDELEKSSLFIAEKSVFLTPQLYHRRRIFKNDSPVRSE